MLRPATPDDAVVFLELEKSVDGAKTYSPTLTKEEYLEELKTDKIFLIEIGGETVGSVMYEIKSPEHAYISGLVVSPKFQGKGIAREAMTRVLEDLKNYKRIDLVTHPENKPAIKLYESLGFKIESQIENYFGDGEPRVVMARLN